MAAEGVAGVPNRTISISPPRKTVGCVLCCLALIIAGIIQQSRTIMIYLKSILVGAAAFLMAVIISGGIAIAVMIRFPQLALRIFPAQHFDIQIGSRYYINFPLWQIVILGAVAFAITFGWMVRRAATRT